MQRTSVWEDGKIVTYTKARIDRTIAGTAGSSEVTLRTRGGMVGRMGQQVDGEPALKVGSARLTFLAAVRPGTYVVIGRAQGEFPVVIDDKKISRLAAGGAGIELVAPQTDDSKPSISAQDRLPAKDVIVGKPVDEIARRIASLWRAAHAP